MNIKKGLSIVTLSATVLAAVFAVTKYSEFDKVFAHITKGSSTITEENALTPVTYNGEDMYVAKATLYDYHSDSEVGTSATPGEITEANDYSKNTFEKFNLKLFNLMKYADTTLSPAAYPMYQGRFVPSGSMASIYTPNNEEFNTSTNFWVAANSPQGIASATQGLVDSTLAYDSNGEGHLTQSNPATGKSANVPYFDKTFLSSNKFDDSELTLGTVRENVSFPFRRVEKDGTTYYEFYSSHDTVRVNAQNKLDYLGKDNAEQVKDSHGNAGFFPYNTSADSASNKLNYGHGVKIEIPFNITKNGKINGNDIIFEFSGDDDVWVFIDGQLALDIGGSHGEISGTLNFSKHAATVSKVKNSRYAFASHSLTSIKENELYNNYTTPFSSELKNKLKDTTKTHTLTFFYMERGMDVANLKLNFNLPEPTKLTVNNTLSTDKINKTFTAETTKVAKADEFVYDIADNTHPKAAKIELKTGEAVLFSNEFEQDDTLITQERALKDSNRQLTTLYSTDWILKDAADTIAKEENSLVINDKRTNETGAFKFANKDNDNSPILAATYTNAPKVGDFTLETKVTDLFKNSSSGYATVAFNYTVKYSNVFGGSSASTPYVGTYTLYKADGSTITKQTSTGIIPLKADEKAVISNIPVETKLEVTAELDETVKLSKMRATKQFDCKTDTYNAIGKINNVKNVVEYTITSKDDTVSTTEVEKIDIPKDNEKNPEDSLHSLDSIKQKTNTTTQNIDSDGLNGYDGTPATGDTSNVTLWIIVAVGALVFAIIMFIIMVIRKRK